MNPASTPTAARASQDGLHGKPPCSRVTNPISCVVRAKDERIGLNRMAKQGYLKNLKLEQVKDHAWYVLRAGQWGRRRRPALALL